MLRRIRTLLDDRANQHVGYLAEYSDPGALYDAVKSLRKKGYTRLDTFSPFPIHGMDAAMGLPVSKLGFMVFVGGAAGAFLGFFLQWWTSAGPQYDWMVNDTLNAFVPYAINVSNKPLFGLEAAVPVMFELTILFSALTAVGGMLALNGLPKPYNPLFHSERFNRATDDAFFLHIAEADKQFEADTTAGDLFGFGALAVEHITHEGATELNEQGEPVEAPALPGEPVLAIAESSASSSSGEIQAR
ncbi:MAG: DUF3341 domain-containing protein [Bacteroidota bacterium]